MAAGKLNGLAEYFLVFIEISHCLWLIVPSHLNQFEIFTMVEQIPLAAAVKLPQKMKEIRITVSSLRLDGVISAAFHLSRSHTVDAIRAGKAERNSLICLKPDRIVEENDELSLRGCGKLKILSMNGETRKGRIALTVGIYL